LAGFTELVATAIANAQARHDLHRVVDEQSALRRVATAVAGAAGPEQVFDLVCQETGRLFGADTVNLVHFTPDGVNLTMAGWSGRGVHMPVDTRLPLDGAINELVCRTGAPGRFDTYDGVPGRLAQRLRGLGIRSEVGAPVVVGGHVWGALIAGTDRPVPLPVGTEDRLARFAELIGTAVGNAADHAELVASRARIVAAGDAARLRLARDLHDGAQQRLVSVVMSLQLADQQRDDPAALHRLLAGALDNARAGIADLRELAAGMHPTILTNRGLRGAARSLADRSAVAVAVTAPEERFAPPVELAAYFVIAEALTNIDKHASASRAAVRVARDRDQDAVTITIDDDGVGGASFDAGHGLLGLRDRVEALGGTLVLDSPPGQGTHLRATLRAASQSGSGPEVGREVGHRQLGLRHEPGRARAAEHVFGYGIHLARGEQHPRRVRGAAQQAGDGEPVRAGKVDVHHHRGRPQNGGCGDRRVAVARLAHDLEAAGVQQFAQNGAERRVVVDHQHPGRCHHSTNLAAGLGHRNRDTPNLCPDSGRGCAAGPRLRR